MQNTSLIEPHLYTMNPSTEQRQPILVTGHHHSATTWVGRILAVSNQVGYIYEPFNLFVRRGNCNTQFKHWYTYVERSNEKIALSAIQDSLAFRYQVLKELPTIQRPKDVGRMIRDWYVCRGNRARGARALVKDPIALLSAPWIADRFNAKVIVTLRHPAAFAASIRQRNGVHPFQHFLEQPLLMQGPLAKFRDDILFCASANRDLVTQAAVLWKVLVGVTSENLRSHPEWRLVRHEDLTSDPLAQFKELYQFAGLEFCDEADQMLLSTTKKPSALKGLGQRFIHDKNQYIRRDMTNITKKWKAQLSNEEIDVVRKYTGDVASEFYTDSDW